MKTVIRFICALSLFASLLSSCSIESGESVPEGVVHIFADKTTIAANGVDAVKFRVMYGSEDISSKNTLTIKVKGPESEYSLKAGASSFSTAVAGKYEISAVYYYGGDIISENTIEVTAIAVKTGKYYQKLLGMQFTSTMCPSCPILSATLKSIQANFPGRISVVSFHVSAMGADPMYLKICDTFFKSVADADGLPAFAFNVRTNTEHIVAEYTKIVNQMNHQLNNFPSTCGVAIETSVADSKATVVVKITSEVATSMKYHVFLVEDALDYDQMGSVSGYLHNNVLRYCKSDNVWGTTFNSGKPLEEGKEYVATTTIPLENEWKLENMRVVAVAMTTSDGGSSYGCNNLNDCVLGSSVDYLLSEK